MRAAAIGITLLALAAPPVLSAGPVAHGTSFTCGDRWTYLRWSDRVDPADARLAITTEDGDVTMLLTDRDVVIQLSNSALRHVEGELGDARRDQDHWLADVIVTAVTDAVGKVLHSSFRCRVRDLRDVDYRHGRLVFVGRDGREVFRDAEVNDTEIARAFSEPDAMRFVREFRRVKAGR